MYDPYNEMLLTGMQKSSFALLLYFIFMYFRFIQFPEGDELEATKAEYWNAYGFPCVAGIVDGTHIPVEVSGDDQELMRNRKSRKTVNIQGKLG